MADNEPEGKNNNDPKIKAISCKDQGNNLARQGNYEGAIYFYNSGLQLDPDNPDIWHNKSQILAKLGRFEEANICQEKFRAFSQTPIVEHVIAGKNKKPDNIELSAPESINKPEIKKESKSSITKNTLYDGELVQGLIKSIEEFRPIKLFKSEELYHTNLFTYLCLKIPNKITFEEQRGRSRPDISVGDVAIEVKGPTDKQGLVTIADKMLRYSQHFNYIIIVLFDVTIFEPLYKEWHEGIIRQYDGKVTIIRKLNSLASEKPTPTIKGNSRYQSPIPKESGGYCIRCGLKILLNPDKPLCHKCYPLWARYSNPKFPEKYCHVCGKKSKQSYSKPICYPCWKKIVK